MSYALTLPTQQLDAKRIIANALVLSAHIAAVAVLMAPVHWEAPPTKRAAMDPPPLVIPVEIPVIVPPTQPTPHQPVRRPATSPVQRTPNALPRPLQGEAPVLPDAALIDDARPTIDIGEVPESESSDSGLSTLAYAVAPPPHYPPEALRAGVEGMVLLRVMVAADGRVEQVLLERSSGHRQLDLAALRQVQSRWRFHPALRDGQPISAWGLVPIAFSLPR